MRRKLTAASILTAIFFLAGCGGGGGSETGVDADAGASPSAKILSWSPPTAYTDSTPLDPSAELDSFEIYVNTSGSFSDSDTPVAYLQAVDPVSGQVTTEFNLDNLGPMLTQGVVYVVSVRAVTLTGAKSDFSPAASFSL